MKADKLILGVLGGVAAGAILGILFAPEKGEKTRKKILSMGNDYAEDIKDKFDTLLVSMNKKYENTLLKDVAPYNYYSIVTNDEAQSEAEIYQFYNQRGAFEQNNTSLKNEFNWGHLPCSFLHQNTVFMLIAAMGKLLFEYIKKHTHQRIPELIKSTAIELKTFINKFVSVVARWIKHGRSRILKLYTHTNYHLLLE